MFKKITSQHYKQAVNLLPQNTERHVLNGLVKPNWFKSSDKFWYTQDIKNGDKRGKQFIVVNPVENTCKPAFDHVQFANALSMETGVLFESENLPFDQFEYWDDTNSITFHYEGNDWKYDLSEKCCERLGERKKTPVDELFSPNGQWSVFTKNHNLYVRSSVTSEVKQLTYDGQPYYDYGAHPECRLTAVYETVNDIKSKPAVIWSPDSKKLLTYRLDQRLVRELHLIQSAPGDEISPKLHSYRYPLPGDEHLPLVELVICDIESGDMVPLDTVPLTIHNVSLFALVSRSADWSKESDKVYFIRLDVDQKVAQFTIAEAKTGKCRVVFEERTDTFFHFDNHNVGDLSPGQNYIKPNIYFMNDGKSFIWHSENDGWSHLYLYDSETGQLINRITSGSWVVRRLLEVDERNGWVYFTAGGREEGRDPYFQHLYRARLDGRDLTLLTPEDAEHIVHFSPNLTYFVDTYSRVDLPPVSVLRSVDGTLIRELERSDIDSLIAQGYQLPLRFTVKARDGITDLYGVMILPDDFNDADKYPIINHVYGGPQRINTPKSFVWKVIEGGRDPLGGAQSLAQLGFVTIIMDGLGTPYREKSFHDVSYGHLEDAGIQDHVIGIQQLAENYPFLDLTRVGVWGLSAGGHASTRALLTYPDFYKVAVSASGNHDNQMYNSLWSKRYQGPYNAALLRSQANATLVDNLKGHLLLVHGDIDDNVHPAQTIRLVDALIKANKDFDLLILPNRHHQISLDSYFIRKKWDYFVKHLLGVEPPKEFAIENMKS